MSMGKKGNFLSFKQARKYVRSLKIKRFIEFRTWAKSNKRPSIIPANPAHKYKDEGWISWGDFLGTRSPKRKSTRRKWKTYKQARKYIQSLGNIKTQAQYRGWAKTIHRPYEMPSSPPTIYKTKGWNGWGEFLGTGNIACFEREFRPFEKARAYVRNLSFKNQKEYTKWAKTNERPQDIPYSPPETYKTKGWVNWGDWLGY